MQTKLVIFDMDGVLHDSESLSLSAISAALEEQGQQLDRPRLEALVIGATFADAALRLEQHLNTKLGDGFADRCGHIWLGLMQDGLPTTAGIEAVLDQLGAHGIAFCLASNSSQHQIDYSLQQSKLAAFFPPSRRFSGLDQPRPKPAPDLHLHCLKMMDVRASEALVFEDTPTGAAGGIAAGIPVIGYVGAHPHPAQQAALLSATGVQHCIQDWQQLDISRL